MITQNSQGRRIARTDEQIAAFWRWFGQSKAVDAQGRPLVVYHGTNQSFASFSKARIGKSTTAASSIAFFFSEDPAEAGEYADLASRQQVADAVSTEKKVARLQKQVKAAEDRGNWALAEKLYLELEAADLGAIAADPSGHSIVPAYLRVERPVELNMWGSFDGHAVAAAIRKARRAKHDGLALKNVYDPVANRVTAFTTNQWVVFDPSQIKSATGNRGTFDSADARLTNPGDLLIPLTKLWSPNWKVAETRSNIAAGKTSRSAHLPLRVSRWGRRYFVLDGNHRIQEALQAGKKSLPAVLDQYVPDMNRTGGAHAGMLADAVRVDAAVEQKNPRKRARIGRLTFINPADVITTPQGYFVKKAALRKIRQDMYAKTGEWLDLDQIEDAVNKMLAVAAQKQFTIVEGRRRRHG